MSKLYVFAIGGTGSRVLKALTMLMATGVKVPVDKIVHINTAVNKLVNEKIKL